MFTLRSMEKCSALEYADGALKKVKKLSVGNYLGYVTEGEQPLFKLEMVL